MKNVEIKMMENPMPKEAGVNSSNGSKKPVVKKRMPKKTKVLEFPDNIIRRTMCRPSIVFIQLFNLLLAGLMFYTWYLYTGFRNLEKPFTIIFLLISIGFFLTFCYAFRSARLMTDKILFAATEKDKMEEVYVRKKSGNNTFLEMIKYENIINFYSNYFYIEGDYYLLKLNVSEMMEHLNQLINIFTIYNCNMKVEYVWTIYMVLMLESFHNAFILFRGKITSDTRDNQALIDLLVDFFCVAFPLVVLFFVIGLPITIPTMLQIMFLPTLGIYVKLKTIQRQFIIEDLRSIRYKAEQRMSMTASRRRMSLFGAKHEEVVIKKQMTFFKRPIQLCFAIINALFGAFMFALLIVQIAQLKTGDEECTARDAQLWNRCTAKVPYCGTVVVPSCNCLILSWGFGGSHNYTEFPYKNNGMMNEMSALSEILAEHGPLKELPDNLCERHTNLKLLFLSNNSLQTLKLDKCEHLISVILDHNELETFPNMASSKESLLGVYMEHNRITEIPIWVGENYILSSFSVFSNDVSNIPASVFNSLSNLQRLDISSNEMIKEIPASIYTSPVLIELRLIDLPRVTSLPEVPNGALHHLLRLDLRNSSFTSLPASFFDLPRLEEVYLAGSPLCSNGWVESVPAGSTFALAMSQPNTGCVKQCSLHCNYHDQTWLYCYPARCNNTVCNYQNGFCVGGAE